MVTSNWGDEHMFFRHQRMDDDLKYKPEWEPYESKYEGFFSLAQECDSVQAMGHPQKSGCPFADILNYLQ